jgi:hypothetical protein
VTLSQFVTSCSFSNDTEGSLRDLTWVTRTWKTSDDCRAIETYKIRDVRALSRDLSSKRSLVQRQFLARVAGEELRDPEGVESCRM